MFHQLSRLRPDIRSAERRDVLGAFLTLLGLMAGHALMETARDALFLASLPASRLPWVYLAIPAAVLVVDRAQRLVPARLQERNVLSALLLVAAAGTLGFWVLLRSPRPWILYALYAWPGVVATALVVRFWTLVGSVFTVTQAKRLFPLIGAGSMLGAIAGAGLARALSTVVEPRMLLLAAAGILLVTAGGPSLAPRTSAAGAAVPASSGPARRRLAAARHGPREAALIGRMVWERPYVRRVALLVLLSSITLTIVDYLFKSGVARHVPAPQLSAFFSTTYLALNLLSLGAQLVLLPWLVRTMGINRVIAVLPLLLLLGAGAVAVVGGLVAVLALKGPDGALRHSLHRTSSEVLYVPLAFELRTQIKGFIDVLGQRGGQAAASLAILAIAGAGGGERALAVAVVALAAGWFLLTLTLRSHYIDVFRSTLQEKSFRMKMDFPQLDLNSLETLIATLNSRNDAEVIAALELLAEEGRTRLIPTLILYHPSSEVVIHALEIFAAAGRDDFVAIGGRLLHHDDPEVRAATLRAWSAVKPDESLLGASYGDPSPAVRATAIVGLIALGGLAGEEADEAIDAELARDDTESHLALARAIHRQPAPLFERALLRLAESPDRAVQLEVVWAMRAIGGHGFLPALMKMLPQRRLRPAVRETLATLGDPALAALDSALADPAVPLPIQRHVPRTLCLFAPQAAGPVLLRHLLHHDDGVVRFKILRALGRLRRDHPMLDLDRHVLDDAIGQTLAGAFRALDLRSTLARGGAALPVRVTPVHQLVLSMLKDKEEHAVDRLFRLLALRHVAEDFHSIYAGLHSPNRATRDDSRELLENLVQHPLRDPLLGLVDDAADDARLGRARPYYTPAGLTYDGVLQWLLENGSESLRCMTVYHIEELRLHGFLGQLQAVQAEPSSSLAGVIERAVAFLAGTLPAREQLSFEQP
jgi:AAA family ATP:ADP antiporter